MIELGINLDDQENSTEVKDVNVDNLATEENKVESITDNEKLELDKTKEEEIDQSIESIPFISEPIKKKRVRSSK